ncbi:helix-turn-helix transcriptional regulator [Nocardia sp. FBN12]
MNPRTPGGEVVTPLHRPGGPHRTGHRRWLNRSEAADYLGVHPRTLANWAAMGRGPRYSKPSGNSCMYRLGDLDAYLKACMVHTDDQPEAA